MGKKRFTTPAIITEHRKIQVSRNRARLVAGTDYSVSGSDVTLIHKTAADSTNWALYIDDEIEVQ